MRLKVFFIRNWKINYLDADTTTNAKGFRDYSNPVSRSYLNAELAHTDHRARLFAFLIMAILVSLSISSNAFLLAAAIF
jgi:hypothetical protein